MRCAATSVLLLMLVLTSAGTAFGQCRQRETQTLFPELPEAFSEFGRSVAMDAGVIFVGAPFHGETGAVFVYRNIGESWNFEQMLRADDAMPGDRFGFSVSVKGAVALVGAPLASTTGAGYVFRFDGNRWVEEQKLTATDGAFGDLFGRRVALDDEVAVVGSPQDDDGGLDSGSVFVFRFDGTRWIEEAKLTAIDADPSDFFGFSVAIDSGVIVSGAIFDDDLREAAGAVYVFRFSGGVWIQEQKLLAESIFGCCGRVGSSVSISGDVILSGSSALAFSEFGATGGTAYIFRFDGVQWVEEQQINSREPGTEDDFTIDVAVDGDVAIIGVSRDDEFGPSSGAALTFRHDPDIGLWREERKLIARDPAPGDRLGFAVDLFEGLAVVGAPQTSRSLIGSGAVSIFSEIDRPSPEAGTVNAASGVPMDVLFVNGSAGGVFRDVFVPASAPLTVRLESPPLGPDPARYILWVWPAPKTGPFDIPAFSTNCQELLLRGESLGRTVNPTPAQPSLQPQPAFCIRSPGIGGRACASSRELPGPATAPWTLVREPASGGFGFLVTIQALIEDRNSTNTFGFSLSNAVALTVR